MLNGVLRIVNKKENSYLVLRKQKEKMYKCKSTENQTHR